MLPSGNNHEDFQLLELIQVLLRHPRGVVVADFPLDKVGKDAPSIGSTNTVSN
jgi:hypothetical protein